MSEKTLTTVDELFRQQDEARNQQEEKQREKERQRARDEEDSVLSRAVKAALHTFMAICNDDTEQTELRIEAAARILGYSASFQPDITLTMGGDGDDEDDEDTGE